MAIIGMRELLRDPTKIFSAIEETREPVLVTNRGRPVAAMYPVDSARAEQLMLAASSEYVESRRLAEHARAEGRTRSLDDAIAEHNATVADAERIETEQAGVAPPPAAPEAQPTPSVDVVETDDDSLLERLRAWGVNRIYATVDPELSDDTETGSPAEQVLLTQVPHGEMAAAMASAYAKAAGELGVCMATSARSAIELLNGLYDAKRDRQPVLAIINRHASTGLDQHDQREIDLRSLFKDVASRFLEVASSLAQIPDLIDRACRTALAERTVAAIIIPDDVQTAHHVTQSRAVRLPVPSSVRSSHPRVVPPDDQLARAAEVLNSGSRVAMLIGQGALHARREVRDLADVLGAGVAKSLLGKAALPDDLPWVTGAIGILGTKPSYDLMRDCDTLLMIGSDFPYSEWFPDPAHTRGVQVDIDASAIGKRYPIEVGLIGDSGETLRALIPMLERKQDRSWREGIEGDVSRWWELVRERAHLAADPTNPQLVFYELSERLPDSAIVISDAESAVWFARDIRLRDGMMASVATATTSGAGIAHAVGAKFAHPERPVFALLSERGMRGGGIDGLRMIARYSTQWSDQRFVILVLTARLPEAASWERRVIWGEPRSETSSAAVSYAAYAETLGLKGIRVDDTEQIAPLWDQALAADAPVVYEAVIDAEVPPLPPHITLDQARALTSTMLAHDPQIGGGVIKKSFERERKV